MPIDINHLYIHFPFCIKKCGYCSFYSTRISKKESDLYYKTLDKEIDFYQSCCDLDLKTLYFGGGTPSLFDDKYLKGLINRFQDILEVTLEANPADISASICRNWVFTGINRVSLGCQSMRNDELKFLGRRHSKKEIYDSVDFLRNAGINNISFDLIYGLPNQKVGHVIDSLKKMTALEPDHISCYCLSLEPDCALANWKNKLPRDEILSDMYYGIVDFLSDCGYKQYELSSFCKRGKESKHNLAYWKQNNYLGCGPSAAGYIPEFRYQNPADIRIWAKLVSQDIFFNNKDIMNKKKEMLDYIMLSLRLIEGLELKQFEDRFGFKFIERYEKILDNFISRELMTIEMGRLKLTKKALFISNEVISSFFS